MDAFPLSALDLPLKLLIWEENGTISVAYTPASVIAARYGVNGRDALVASLDRALEALVASIG